MSRLLFVIERWDRVAFRASFTRHRFADRYTLRVWKLGFSVFATAWPERFAACRVVGQ